MTSTEDPDTARRTVGWPAVIRARLLDSGVYYGWAVTAACFLLMGAIWSVSASFGVFFEPIVGAFGEGRANTSLVFSVQTFVMYFGAAVFGGVVDRYGVRRLLVAGTGLFAVGLALTSRAGSIFQLYLVYGVVTGTGMSIIYVIGYTTVPRWFDRRRGTATAIATMGNGVGILVFPAVSSALIASVGWQSAYLVVMALLVAALALAWLVLADNPEAVDAETSAEFPGGYVPETSETAWVDQVRTVAADVRSRRFALVYVGFGLIWLSVFTNYVHLVAYVTDAGLARSTGVLALGLMGGASIPGRFVFGVLSDRLGRVRVCALTGGLMGLFVLALPVLAGPTYVVAFAVLFGLAYGGNGALVSPVVADVYGTSNLNARYGLVATTWGLAAVAGPYAAGASYDALGSYVPVLVAVGGLAVVGSVCFALVERGLDGQA